MTESDYFAHDQEPDAEQDTLLGQTAPTLDEETGNAVIREINRREALGLPGVPGGDWDD